MKTRLDTDQKIDKERRKKKVKNGLLVFGFISSWAGYQFWEYVPSVPVYYIGQAIYITCITGILAYSERVLLFRLAFYFALVNLFDEITGEADIFKHSEYIGAILMIIIESIIFYVKKRR